MTNKTIIHNPPRESSGAGWAVAVVILAIVVLFLIFGLPRLRDGGGTNINVPERIEVDTNPQP